MQKLAYIQLLQSCITRDYLITMIHSPIQSVNPVFWEKSRKVNRVLSLSVLQQRHIRNYYNHTHLDQAYNGEVWLGITNAASLQLSGPPGAI